MGTIPLHILATPTSCNGVRRNHFSEPRHYAVFEGSIKRVSGKFGGRRCKRNVPLDSRMQGGGSTPAWRGPGLPSRALEEMGGYRERYDVLHGWAEAVHRSA